MLFMYLIIALEIKRKLFMTIVNNIFSNYELKIRQVMYKQKSFEKYILNCINLFRYEN